MDEKENEFAVNVNWAQFVFSKMYGLIKNRVTKDASNWTCELNNLLSLIHELDVSMYPDIRNYFNDSIPDRV